MIKKLIDKKKKGEVTTKQLVTLLVLIASFIIILILIFRLNLGDQTNQEICRNSVLLRDKSAILTGPLDCKTNYVCISGGEECDDTSYLKVQADNKEETMKVLADEMASCWWQFGEAKANYLGLDNRIGWGKNSCAICSMVHFDTGSSGDKITYREFYNYLASTKRGGEDQTYFAYLYGSNDVNKFQNEISYLKIDLDNNFINDQGNYAIVTGVKQGAYWGMATSDIFIYPYYLKSENIQEKLSCDEFLTKA